MEERVRLRKNYLRDRIWDSLAYVPTVAQKEILDDDHLSLLVAGGLRGGKSRTAAMKAFLLTLQFIADYPEASSGRVAWLVGSDYEQTRAEFSDPGGSLQADLEKYGLVRRSTKRVDPGQIEVPVPGGKPFLIKTKSAEGPLGMESPVWIIACEAQLLLQDTYFLLRSRVLEARSKFPGYGMLYLEGTFASSLGWYPVLWQKWQIASVAEKENARSFSLPTHSNTALFPGGEGDPEILKLKAELPPELFTMRHLGVPVPPSGRVFPSFDPTVHIREVEYLPDEEVMLAIDPGYSGRSSTYAVEFCQKIEIEKMGIVQTQWRVFDEIAINKTLPTFANFTVKDVCDLAMMKKCWSNPHKSAVIDIAGSAHAGAQESNEEVWMKRTGLVLSHQRVLVGPGIDRMKTMLQVNPQTGEPNVVFSPRAKLVLSEFGAWPNPFDGNVHIYRYPEDASGQVLSARPRDEYNDGIKALTYLFVSRMGYADRSSERTRIRVIRRHKASVLA